MYRPLIWFLLPLVITELVFELGIQVLNGGIARVPRATETLAAYGIAWGLASFSPDRGNNAVPIRPSATCLADRYRQLCHDDGHGRKRRVGIRIPADPDCAGRPHSPARTG